MTVSTYSREFSAMWRGCGARFHDSEDEARLGGLGPPAMAGAGLIDRDPIRHRLFHLLGGVRHQDRRIAGTVRLCAQPAAGVGGVLGLAPGLAVSGAADALFRRVLCRERAEDRDARPPDHAGGCA